MTSVDAERRCVLTVSNLEVVYSSAMRVLHGVSIEVPDGAIVALLGANGAGKTTLLRAITGLLPVHRGRITKGSIDLDGTRIDGKEPSAIVRHGIGQVMEGRRVFAELSVAENLRAGSLVRRDRPGVKEAYERVMDLFPLLRSREGQRAGYLSGGEQQMLAMGQALMAAPRVLLLDEPSLGLSALNVRQIRNLIVDINRQGTGVLLIEQNAKMALSIADHGYVLDSGQIVRAGRADALRDDEDVREFYLGIGETGRESFADVKSYRRHKRWSA